MHSSQEPFPDSVLRRLRKLNGWSQSDVAEKVGTTFENVSRWERGKTLPSFYYQQRLCVVFSKDPEELGFVQNQMELTAADQLLKTNQKAPNKLLSRQRRLHGWTQGDVAERIGTYSMNVSRWERGETTPDSVFQQKLSKLFQKSYEDLGLG